MTHKIEMTAKQLASLDLLIERKKAGAKDFTDDVADNLAAVSANATVAAVTAGAAGATPVAAIAATIGAAAAATAVATRAIGSDFAKSEHGLRDHWNEIGKQMPLDALLEVRKHAIIKEK